jgi:hypothetical protein
MTTTHQFVAKPATQSIFDSILRYLNRLLERHMIAGVIKTDLLGPHGPQPVFNNTIKFYDPTLAKPSLRHVFNYRGVSQSVITENDAFDLLVCKTLILLNSAGCCDLASESCDSKTNEISGNWAKAREELNAEFGLALVEPKVRPLNFFGAF